MFETEELKLKMTVQPLHLSRIDQLISLLQDTFKVINKIKTMKFFIPAADTDSKRDNAYNAIVLFAQMNGWKVSPKRFYKIRSTQNGKEFTETFGERTIANGETVIAILDADPVYLVCSANRGVVLGEPMLVGHNSTLEIVEFKN